MTHKAFKLTPLEEAEHNYEGALSDIDALVDRFALSIIGTGDLAAAWWLCANYAKRINCYPDRERARLIACATWHGKPPKGRSWSAWFERPAVAATHKVKLLSKWAS